MFLLWLSVATNNIYFCVNSLWLKLLHFINYYILIVFCILFVDLNFIFQLSEHVPEQRGPKAGQMYLTHC